jgi:hypothetical protein
MKRKPYSRKICPKGSISRLSYKKSVGGREIRVRSGCVKSKGLRSRGKRTKRVLPSLKKGSLTKYGYSVHNSAELRHKALKKALKEYGYSSLIKKLNAVKILTKNTHPSTSRIYGQDIKFLQNMNPKKSKRLSKRP